MVALPLALAAMHVATQTPPADRAPPISGQVVTRSPLVNIYVDADGEVQGGLVTGASFASAVPTVTVNGLAVPLDAVLGLGKIPGADGPAADGGTESEATDPAPETDSTTPDPASSAS